MSSRLFPVPSKSTSDLSLLTGCTVIRVPRCAYSWRTSFTFMLAATTNRWRAPSVRRLSGAKETLQLVHAHEDFTGVAALRGADDPPLLKLVDDVGGADVADLHLPLQQRHRA